MQAQKLAVSVHRNDFFFGFLGVAVAVRRTRMGPAPTLQTEQHILQIHNISTTMNQGDYDYADYWYDEYKKRK